MVQRVNGANKVEFIFGSITNRRLQLRLQPFKVCIKGILYIWIVRLSFYYIRHLSDLILSMQILCMVLCRKSDKERIEKDRNSSKEGYKTCCFLTSLPYKERLMR